jgi:hypothetical protein
MTLVRWCSRSRLFIGTYHGNNAAESGHLEMTRRDASIVWTGVSDSKEEMLKKFCLKEEQMTSIQQPILPESTRTTGNVKEWSR